MASDNSLEHHVPVLHVCPEPAVQCLDVPIRISICSPDLNGGEFFPKASLRTFRSVSISTVQIQTELSSRACLGRSGVPAQYPSVDCTIQAIYQKLIVEYRPSESVARVGRDSKSKSNEPVPALPLPFPATGWSALPGRTARRVLWRLVASRDRVFAKIHVVTRCIVS